MSNEQYKEDNSLIEKIKRFFKKLFKKQSIQEINDSQNGEKFEIKESEVKTDKTKESFENSLKVDVKNNPKNDAKIEEFIDNFEKHPELFYKLPIEKLEKLEDYYEKSIKDFKEKLAKLNVAS